MRYRALIPVKALSAAKSRLIPYLSQEQRNTLVLAMLRHVLRTLQDSNMLEQISVVSPDSQVLDYARECGVQALAEELPGHNASLHAAALKELAAGTPALLTIAADLPLLQAGDIRAFLEQSYNYPVVLAPSRDGSGTNALLTRPPLALPYLFGINSLQKYQRAANERQLSNTIYNSVGLALDIDTVDDLDDLHELQVLSGAKERIYIT
jgi:2-phospho-L-lactate guanylyltransferase